MSAASLSRIASDGLRGAKRAATRVAIPLAAILGLSACVTPPPRVVAVPSPPPRPQTVFVYPNNGQSAEQTDRDRYECHLWAVQQTGVDPSRADANPYERVVVQPATPPGANTAAGAGATSIAININGHHRRAASGRRRVGARRRHGSHRRVGSRCERPTASSANAATDQHERISGPSAGGFLPARVGRLPRGPRLHRQLAWSEFRHES